MHTKLMPDGNRVHFNSDLSGDIKITDDKGDWIEIPGYYFKSMLEPIIWSLDKVELLRVLDLLQDVVKEKTR